MTIMPQVIRVVMTRGYAIGCNNMKIVLHICCAVCAAGVAERLAAEGHDVLGLFYNPNIHPEEEYKRRLEATSRVARELNFPLKVAPYTPQEWLEATASLADEQEGGKRCAVCFRMRLEEAYRYLKEEGGDAFTTTLTVSPHKAAAVINQLGRQIGGDSFLARDFKKDKGFERAMERAKELGLYRQHYCGCRYSLRESRHQH